MILIDANILVYAHVSSFAQHNLARDWLDQQLNASTSVGLPWPSVLAFLRLVTNPRVFEYPEPIHDAWQQVRTWLKSETTWIPQPTERHADLLGEFRPQSGTLICWANFSHYLALTVTSSPTLTSLHWLWNAG